MAEQLARGIWAEFAPGEQPFRLPNGMEDNLRLLDDHIGLYTKTGPVVPSTARPVNPLPGDGQIYTDGTYAVFNLSEWRTYPARKGLRAVLESGTESWLNTGVGWAQFSVLDTGPAAARAEAAADRAESARELALIQAGVYPDEATGRAAVADGQAFKVQGDGDVAAREYRRINAGTSVFIADYPSAAFVQRLGRDMQLRGVQVQRAKRTGTEVFNGAQFWNGSTSVGANAQSGGFRIPAGQVGNVTYVRTFFDFNVIDRARYQGRPCRFYVILKTSANFSLAVMDGAVEDPSSAIGAPLFYKLDDTTWAAYWDFTPSAGVPFISMFLRKSGPAAVPADYTVWVQQAFFVPQDTGVFRDSVDSVTKGRDSGDLARFALPSGEVFNGAARRDAGWGLTIPSGQTGLTSYVGFVVPIEPVAKYVGAKVRVVLELDTSVDFTAVTQPVAAMTVYDVDLAPAGAALDEVQYSQDSRSHLRVEFFYTLTGTEQCLRPFVQIGGASGVRPADGFMTFRSLNVVVDDVTGVAPVRGRVLPSREELASELRLGLSEGRVESGDMLDSITAISEAFNGATVRDSGMGIAVPAGSTGTQSYCGFAFRVSGIAKYIGTRIRIRTFFRCSAGFLNKAVFSVGMTIYNEEGVGGQRPSYAMVMPMDDGVFAVDVFYDIAGDEVRLRPFFQLSPASAAQPTPGYFTYAGMSVSVEKAIALATLPSNPGVKAGAVPFSRSDVALAFRQALTTDPIDSGELFEFMTPVGEAFQGASMRSAGRGITIPAGQTGRGSYTGYKVDVTSISQYAGAQLRITVLSRTSANLQAETPLETGLTVWTRLGAVVGRNADRPVSLRAIGDGLIEVEYFYTLQGDEAALRPFTRVSGAAPARSAEGFMEYMAMRIAAASIDAVTRAPGTLVRSRSELMLVLRANLVAMAVAANGYLKTVKVAKDGSGDYTSLAVAWATEGGGTSATRRVHYLVYEGEYEQYNAVKPQYSDTTGVGRREAIHILGYRLPSTTPTEIEYSQTFWWNTTGTLRNLWITAQNMRYPIHSDSGASNYRALQVIEDCLVEHIGNEEARTWRTENGLDPAAVWTSEHAWGCGTHSGQRIISNRTQWISRTSPFYFHNNKDFDEPCVLELNNSQVRCTTPTGRALWVQPLGSGTPDRLVINNSQIDGRLELLPVPMLSQKRENYRGNQNDEVAIYISGSSPVAWTSVNQSVVLVLASAEGAQSAVQISGSAAPVLFGSAPDYQYGGLGFAACVRSAHAIYCANGFAGLDLGSRLGNRTGAPLTLNIRFDGAIDKTITLGADYTGMSNAAVIAVLNAALADASRSFYEDQPYDGVAKVFQTDREKVLKNDDGANVILKGQVVAFKGSKLFGRRAVAGDARPLLAGIALENIAPGRLGRVQFSGQFAQQQLAFDGAPALAFGDTFGVGANAGRLVEGAVTPLLRCIDAGAISIFELIA